MKDRKPKYPGRVMLTPVEGQSGVYDMERADEPEDVGTPINKMTLLTDDTAESLGLDPETDPTPSMAFRALYVMAEASAWKVGDVIETVRDDLGDNWLLCNGDVVPEGEYPELREVLPYNTEWRRMLVGTQIGANYYDYEEIRPLPVSGQWLLITSFFRTQRSGTHKAAVYDSDRETITEITCPTIEDAVGAYGIFGLTHNGDEYVLGVTGNRADSSDYYKVYFYTSTGIDGWTLAYSCTVDFQYCLGKSLVFDGENIIWFEEYYGSNYITRTRIVKKDFTGLTMLQSATRTDSVLLVQMPDGYWGYSSAADSIRDVYPAGSSTYLFYFTRNKADTIAFFSDDFWVGLPSSKASTFEVADLTTSTKTTLNAKNIVESSGNTAYFCGMDYDKNTHEWVLYIEWQKKNGSAFVPYAARISEESDPTDITQYSVYPIEHLPEYLLCEQMKPDREQIHQVGTTEIYIRDPNKKYLPEHDGETNKYICVSRNIRGGGINGVTGSCNCRLVFTDDGEGNVELEVIRRDE